MWETATFFGDYIRSYNSTESKWRGWSWEFTDLLLSVQSNERLNITSRFVPKGNGNFYVSNRKENNTFVKMENCT